jgi:hypothetical protein
VGGETREKNERDKEKESARDCHGIRKGIPRNEGVRWAKYVYAKLQSKKNVLKYLRTFSYSISYSQ